MLNTSITDINETLKERTSTHGCYTDVVKIYNIFTNAKLTLAKVELSNEEKMAYDMIAMKLSRILCGKIRGDSWHDIAGYATLAEQSIINPSKEI